MQRRKFLATIGSVAAGSAAVLGTGAYSAARMDRDANIDVTTDPNGLVGLVPGSEEVVGLNGGELYIDFTSDEGGQGVNVNSSYIVGSFHHVHVGDGANQVDGDYVFDSNNGANGGTVHSSTMSAWGYAFKVINQSSGNRDVTLSFDADENPFNGYLGFGLERPWGTRKSIEIEGPTVTDSDVIADVPPGAAVYVSFVVSTIDAGTPADDLSGTLTVDAA